MDLQTLQNTIISHPLFQKLKTVEEHFPGYHDHESVYDHLLKTAKIATEQLDGHFITNASAKEKFLELVNQEIHGTDLKTIMVLTALTHDVGKLLVYTEGNQTKPLRIEKSDGITSMPGHPFWGGRIVVPEILKEIELSVSAKQMIADVVKVHNAYEEPYFTNRKEWAIEELISDIKSGATGYYEEALFNLYCDCYTAPAFVFAKGQIEKVFNDESFYDKRMYKLQ
jgi:hypothetical protein